MKSSPSAGQSGSLLGRYLGGVFFLALLYIVTGRLGLMLAVPPGYATFIWPPSGIAIGFLVIFSGRLWPGVLLGSFLLNSYISGVFGADGSFEFSKLASCFGIAVGSTLQALTARWLVTRFIGIPLDLQRSRDVFSLLLAAGPLACLVAATIGVSSLYCAGVVSPAQVGANWLAWWTGDVLGVLVFFPLVAFCPGRRPAINWRGRPLGTLPITALFAILLSLGLTLSVWHNASVEAYEQARNEFDSLARDNERALLNRVQSYHQALLGGTGFVRGSREVSRREWHTYVQDIELNRNFPGMRGFGYIQSITPAQTASFEAKARKDEAPTFAIHPLSEQTNYVILYVEPEEDNRAAIGLNIAFEKHRKEAADLARDSGEAAITRRIELVQDAGKTAGFLLLQPTYKLGYPMASMAQRRAAFIGWVYAPFIAEDFLKGLTKSQGQLLEMSVYDGTDTTASNLFYTSLTGANKRQPQFSVTKKLEVMQQQWSVVWRSTPSFERAHANDAPLYILISGLVFTVLLATFLIIVTARQTDDLQWFVEEGHLVLPLTLFICIAGGSLYLCNLLQMREYEYIANTVDSESRKMDQLISVQAQDKISALKRMSQRWNIGGGTSYKLWSQDAYNYITQLQGVTAIAWVDAGNKVRWTTTQKGQNLDFTQLTQQERGFWRAAKQGLPQVTPPNVNGRGDNGQSSQIFFVSLPLTKAGKFDGYLLTIFNIDVLLRGAIAEEAAQDYAVYLLNDGKEFFRSSGADEVLESYWSAERSLHMYNGHWVLKVVPTQRLARSQMTSLPETIVVTGLLIGALLAGLVRYVMIARVRSGQVESREEQLRLLIKNTPAAVAMFDRDMKYIMTSQRWLHDYGLQGRELVGKSHYEIFPEILKMPYWVDIHQRALRGENFDQHEESWVRASGKKEWVTWAIHPWFYETGKVGGIVMFTDVITNRKEAESALMRSNALNSAILSSAHSLIIAMDVEGKVILFNSAAEQALGYSAEEVIGKATPLWWHDLPEIEQRALALSQQYERHIEPGFDVFTLNPIRQGAESREWTFVRKDGSRFPGNATVTPLRDSSEQIIGYLGLIEDISERKQQQQSLITSEETFRSAMEHAAIGMALVAPDGTWLKVNQALCDLLGYSKEQLLAGDFQSISHPDDLAQDLEQVTHVLAGEIDNYQIEKRYFRQDGQCIWTLLNVSLVRDSNGAPKYFISQIQDISHQKEVERLKNEFVSVVSHELRTPLTSIRGSLGLISGIMSKDLPEKTRSLVEIALRNSEHLVLLINDILDIDKIASGQMRFDIKAESLGDLVRQAIDRLQPAAEKIGVRIKAELPVEAIFINVDAARFIQVMTNLLSNAMKFSPSQGIVQVCFTCDESWVRVCVQDEGPGIPAEFQSRIFGKFSQADTSVTRAKGGSGLGLYISKRLVESMDGRIGFDTEMSVGSTFWVEFPVSAGAQLDSHEVRSQ